MRTWLEQARAQLWKTVKHFQVMTQMLLRGRIRCYRVGILGYLGRFREQKQDRCHT